MISLVKTSVIIAVGLTSLLQIFGFTARREARNDEQPQSRLNASLLLDNPLLHGVIDGLAPITGLTVLGSRLFAVEHFVLHVYDANTLNSIRNRTSPFARNVVASPQHNCLFITSLTNIRRHNFTNNRISHWPVGDYGDGLSLTSTHNILVTLPISGKIKEYTAYGSLVREISLESSVKMPCHSVQLSGDTFAVSHSSGDSGDLHRVCIVDENGKVVQCYGGAPGSDVGQLKYPRGLAVDEVGNMLVADSANDRVVLLSPSLGHLGYVQVPGFTLRYPRAIHLDLPTRRLYISEVTFPDPRVFMIGF